MSDTIEAKLANLGVNPEDIAKDVQILSSVSRIADLKPEIRKKYVRYAGDIDQYLLPMFRPLFQTSADVRERVNRELSGLGIPAEVVASYFTEYGEQPYLILRFRYQEILDETKDRFIQAADEVMLKLLKEYLGLQK